jgi:hypothetical protein
MRTFFQMCTFKLRSFQAAEVDQTMLVNQTMLEFTWQTLNITDTQIEIQLLFVYPNFISSENDHPESVTILLLKPFTDGCLSQDSGLTIEQQSVTRSLLV